MFCFCSLVDCSVKRIRFSKVFLCSVWSGSVSEWSECPLTLESIFSPNQHPIFEEPIKSEDFTARVACYLKIFSRLGSLTRFQGLKFSSYRSSGRQESLVRGMISIFCTIELSMNHNDDIKKMVTSYRGNFFELIPKNSQTGNQTKSDFL